MAWWLREKTQRKPQLKRLEWSTSLKTVHLPVDDTRVLVDELENEPLASSREQRTTTIAGTSKGCLYG